MVRTVDEQIDTKTLLLHLWKCDISFTRSLIKKKYLLKYELKDGGQNTIIFLYFFIIIVNWKTSSQTINANNVKTFLHIFIFELRQFLRVYCRSLTKTQAQMLVLREHRTRNTSPTLDLTWPYKKNILYI